MLTAFLIILLICTLVGVLPTWSYSANYGYGPSGAIGVIVIILVLFMLFARL